MKIVIDIPDYDVELIKEYYEGHDIVESTYSYIYHGQPLSEILDKISAEIKELTKAHCIQVMDREDIPLLALDIIEKYKGDSE